MHHALRSTPAMIQLSKSRYLSGWQCHLKLWYDCHERQWAVPADSVQLALFETGRRVGALARERYSGGQLVDFDHRHSKEALGHTARLMTDRSVPAIFEAAIEYRRVLIRVDVLRRNKRSWDLIEVKSGTQVKIGIHDQDVAVQLWVMRGAGVKVKQAGILNLNREYVYDGKALDLEQLFVFSDLTDIAEDLLPDVGKDIRAMKAMLRRESAPEILPGPQCSYPYDCPYYLHCTRDMVLIPNPVTELPSLHFSRLEALEAEGIESIEEVPDDFPLTDLQQTVRDAVINGREWISAGLGAALSTVRYPVYHLDFETFAPAIPHYSGTRPYDALPFQFSVHIEYRDGRLKHREYLHEGGGDPRRPLAEALVKALGTKGSICIYTRYEAMVIRKLAEDLPDLAEPLNRLLDRLWDLHPVIRGHYYHPDFHGSFSIKSVLPVLVPDLGYGTLAIQDGQTAAVTYERSLEVDDPEEGQRAYAALREYCGLDTEAMVRLREALRRKVDGRGQESP
jgi:hypothetical protein